MGINEKQTEEEAFFTSEKYADFISDFEDKWLQFATAEDRTKAFFGNIAHAKILFNKWQNGEDIFAEQRKKAFSK